MATRGSLGDLLAKAGLHVSRAAEPSAAATSETPGVAATAEKPGASVKSPGPEASSDGIDLARCGKLVVRKERKGRGGKIATVLAGLAPELRDPVARALRRALGCGATLEDDTVVVQGDLAQRVERWLAAHGARRIVLGT